MSQTEQLPKNAPPDREPRTYSLKDLQQAIRTEVLRIRMLGEDSRVTVDATASQQAHHDEVSEREYLNAIKNLGYITEEEYRSRLEAAGYEDDTEGVSEPQTSEPGDAVRASGEAAPVHQEQEPNTPATEMGRLAKMLAGLRNRR